MTGSVPNVKKAKAIHEQRQQARDANVAAMKRGSVATSLQGFINPKNLSYPIPFA